MDFLNRKTKQLDEYGNKIPQLVELSNKVGLSTGQIIMILLAVWMVIICVMLGATIIMLAISVFYPALKSI